MHSNKVVDFLLVLARLAVFFPKNFKYFILNVCFVFAL